MLEYVGFVCRGIEKMLLASESFPNQLSQEFSTCINEAYLFMQLLRKNILDICQIPGPVIHIWATRIWREEQKPVKDVDKE